MGKYILKRIALAFVTIWAVATITFFLMNLVPGGPFLSEKAISPAATKALEAKYGLDKPMAERYFTYISDAAHGDFGDSLKQRGRTVMDIIATKFPVSARLGGMAVVLALCVGVPLGVLAAYKRGTFIDSLFSVIDGFDEFAAKTRNCKNLLCNKTTCQCISQHRTYICNNRQDCITKGMLKQGNLL